MKTPRLDPSKLTDSDLFLRLNELKAEAEYRNHRKLNTTDDIDFPEQEAAKRALCVAAVGQHSVLIIAPPNEGERIQNLGRYLGVPQSLITLPCPCGYLSDPRRACHCKPPDLQRWRRKLHPVVSKIDMFVHVHPPTANSVLKSTRRTPPSDMRDTVQSALYTASSTLNSEMETLLRQAISELGLSTHRTRLALKVAESIARLSKEPEVTLPHLSEAIFYVKEPC